MPIKTQFTIIASSFALGLSTLHGGIYSGPTDTAHSIDPAVHYTSSQLVGWASSVVDYSPSATVTSGYDNPANALGEYNTSLVSLGDLNATEIAEGKAPGSITLGFGSGFTNGAGWDFAVFENGFNSGNNLFMELAFVEVSSDGINFARFDSLSTNANQGSAFSYYDTTNVHNLAGKHSGGYGTTFDLSDLSGNQLVLDGLVDLNSIGYVRLVDIPGNGSYLDSEGNPIYDNWLTTGTGGLDLRGIGYSYAVPEPANLALTFSTLVLIVAWRRKRTHRA